MHGLILHVRAWQVNLRETTEELLSVARVVPVFNENDAISDRSGDKVRPQAGSRVDCLLIRLPAQLHAFLGAPCPLSCTPAMTLWAYV